MDQLIAEIKKIPPVTRFVCGSSLGVTLSVLMGAVAPYSVLFVKDYVFKKFQVWRLYTSFFLGGGGINYIFEFVMLFRAMNDLESRSYSGRSADLAWQLIWACVGIIGATWPLRCFVFTKPLLACLIYLYSSLAPPGAMTSIMGLVTLPIKYYPYVMIGLDLLMAGPQVAAQSVAGAVVGHAWWWSVWGGELGSQGLLGAYSRAPQWMRNLVGETNAPPPPAAGGTAAGLARAGIHVQAPRQAPQPATTSGYNWGSGRRLGSD
ncbi:Der1-like family-domain-containing protein [Gymnopilus junonius]|uniref:Derlin n=1 Tax=Gymnopilus junonius TaxID=109634 RepID=A0A9P5TFH5_GYMJU|nr:Der1-like family-domain-containing protein [Gymnopilus junonius]